METKFKKVGGFILYERGDKTGLIRIDSISIIWLQKEGIEITLLPGRNSECFVLDDAESHWRALMEMTQFLNIGGTNASGEVVKKGVNPQNIITAELRLKTINLTLKELCSVYSENTAKFMYVHPLHLRCSFNNESDARSSYQLIVNNLKSTSSY